MYINKARMLRCLLTILISFNATTISLTAGMVSSSQTIRGNTGTSQNSASSTLFTHTAITSIQDTINRASPGSTITLPAGTYTETFTINKQIYLKGAGTSQTFITATSTQNGYAICITAENVIISGLDITNQGLGLYTTGVKISASHTTIQECSFHDTPIGIAIWSSDNTIDDCHFEKCDDEGVVFLGSASSPCRGNTIRYCTFQQNCDGIELQYAAENSIEYCQFTDNSHAGIDAIVSSNNYNTIKNCEFIKNQGYGIYLAESSNNNIIECSFSDDPITLVQAVENTVSNSKISSIQLREHSSLHIDQCRDINPSAITSQQSSYEISPAESTQTLREQSSQGSVRYPLLVALLSRLSEIKTRYLQHL